jgi:hypothetical protein
MTYSIFGGVFEECRVEQFLEIERSQYNIGGGAAC